MNRKQVLSIGVLVCAAVLVLAVLWGLRILPGGGPANGFTGYTAGDTEITAPVKNLDLEWTSGRVVFATHSGSGVLLRETADKPLSEDEKLQWQLDGDTLRLRYEKPAFRLFSVGKHKVLTVTLPEGLALTDVRITATSAELEIPGLQADSLLLQTTSGSINAAAAARVAEASSTSGDIRLTLTGPVERLNADATSGNIGLKAAQAQQISVNTTSGGIRLDVEQAGDIRLGSTSGNIDVSAQRFASLQSGSTSGGVQAFLPAQPGFTAALDSTSGRVEYTLPLTKQGGAYVCGDGSARVDISTTSGGITLKDLPEAGSPAE